MSGWSRPIDGLALAQAVDLVGVGLLDAQHDVGLRDTARRCATTLAPAAFVSAVGEWRRLAGAALDEHLGAGGGQRLRQRLGHERDAPLVGRALLHDTNLHDGKPLGTGLGDERRIAELLRNCCRLGAPTSGRRVRTCPRSCRRPRSRSGNGGRHDQGAEQRWPGSVSKPRRSMTGAAPTLPMASAPAKAAEKSANALPRSASVLRRVRASSSGWTMKPRRRRSGRRR